MTIYAIVNNLISSYEHPYINKPVWTIISSAAILQGGNPFFVPDFASRFEARTALAVKIGKLGKGIAPRFAERYVDSVAPAILFVATDLLESVKSSGLPWTPAISYDRSLALGKFFDISLEECKNIDISISLECQGASLKSTWNANSLMPAIEDTIAQISRDNALKMGDIILLGINNTGHEVRPDMRANLSINGNLSLAFNIR